MLEALEYMRDEEIKRIQTEKIKSMVYKLLIPKKKRRAIDTEKFQLLFPELYAEHVYVKPYNSGKDIRKKSTFSGGCPNGRGRESPALRKSKYY